MYLILPVAVTSCYFFSSTNSGNPPVPPKKKALADVVGKFQSKIYPVSEHEHVLVFDIPNRMMPSRCWTYVNENIKTSNMHCDFDQTPTDDMPIQGDTLER